MLFLCPSPWCSPAECRHSPGESRLSCSSPGEQHAKHQDFVSGRFQDFGIRADLESGRVRSPWCLPGEKHAFHQGKGRIPEVWFSPGENQFPLENTKLDVMLRIIFIIPGSFHPGHFRGSFPGKPVHFPGWIRIISRAKTIFPWSEFDDSRARIMNSPG